VIRTARAEDRGALYDICLRTGDRGADASALHADPELLGHVYVGPYLALEPGFAYVVADPEGRVQGYCLGTADSAGFAARCEAQWWPDLRRRYPEPVSRPPADQELVELIHRPPVTDSAIVARFPGNLHIDLLPAIQGRGLGRALIDQLAASLVAAGCPGLHLGVARDNERAVSFYRRLGFDEVGGDARTALLATPLA
jgi:GNAT superfamily N-acetyltransferase